jgi:L-fuculose-phosphate aldolase
MEQLKKDIIETGRMLYEHEFISSSDGNISIKIDEKRILTTPTGMNKGLLKRSDLVVVDRKGKKLQGMKNPSSEIDMHLFIYDTRPDISAIVHAHPPYCTGFAAAGIPLDRCVLPEVILTIGAIPLASYATPSTKEVAESLKELVPNSDALLLANHGAVTLGKNLKDAYWKMERIEHASKISYIAKTLGGEQVLPKKEVDKLIEIREKSGSTELTAKCWSCGDCIGDPCVNHDYKQKPAEIKTGEIDEIVRKVLSSLT